ncbi:helix-turn-helix domain-containing protein [Streptomyces sp. MBT49]|uniref:helix-turn-helix domain-containing protein n=1 Tax=Streptomyces sp. MBT49 TaxID=1488380 RepID=UPI00190C7EAF|nr:helix-turn-helix domain-containing protein [Streptomyces sp. MBT49]MBK3630401.1 helix-turn-helix domain-containing protein [Streptomyces sp. MBT49]
MLSRRISGAKLRRVREDRCLRVTDLATAAGCSTWNIYKIEQGDSQPSPQVYAALKTALRAEDHDLVDETPDAA